MNATAAAPGSVELCARLGYQFTDPDLLTLAVTHRSYPAENPGALPNERLEFLGDSVLSVVVTDHIYRAYPTLAEGELAKVRASVVSARTLADVAGELDLGSVVRLGKGEAGSGGRNKPSILVDTFEAIIGAVYLDGGLEAIRPLILELLGDHITACAEGPGGHDYKTRLQELAARHLGQQPAYDVRDEGPDHEKRFYATVRLDGRPFGTGEGRSKKLSEQAAARSAWQALVDAIDGGSLTPSATASLTPSANDPQVDATNVAITTAAVTTTGATPAAITGAPPNPDAEPIAAHRPGNAPTATVPSHPEESECSDA